LLVLIVSGCQQEKALAGQAVGDVCSSNDNCDANNNEICFEETCQVDTDGDGVIDSRDGDADGDGIPTSTYSEVCTSGVAGGCNDNCPFTMNENQRDLDGDRIGDACDNDIDGDGVIVRDNCYVISNQDQADGDSDGVGDACDICPTTHSSSEMVWADADGDKAGDDCDCNDDNTEINPGATELCSNGIDDDCDGIVDTDCDTDGDGDGVPDSQDNCYGIYNPGQEDNDDLDAFGDACDGTGGDADGDGIDNGIDFDADGDGSPDNCPLTYHKDQTNTDNDRMGNVCDADDDNDGKLDGADTCPQGQTGWVSSADTDIDDDGCNAAEDSDTDGDSQPDITDNCPLVVNVDQKDMDTDGIGDACDCGDGIIPSGESCDDSNTANGDGCSSSCQVEAGYLCPSSSNLIGFWKGEGNVFEAYGKFESTNNGVTFSPGKVGNGFVFDGSAGKYVQVTVTPELQIPGELTVSAWVNPASVPTGPGNLVASTYRHSSTAGSLRGWSLGDEYGSTDHFYFNVCSSDGTCVSASKQNFFAENLNRWTHVVGVYKPAEYIRLYVDSQLVVENTENVPASIGYHATTPLRIGHRADKPDQGMWDGMIDELQIYNRALNSDDQYLLYTGCLKDTDSDGQPDNLVAGLTTTLVADTDDDNDGVLDVDDAFPLDAAASIDTDSDKLPDSLVAGVTTTLVADTDDDGDGVLDVDDAFPLDAAASIDTDSDKLPDSLVAGLTTTLVADADDDGDNHADRSDNCPMVVNANQQDTDTDGVGDVCDTCPDNYNPSQSEDCGVCRAPGFSLTAANIDATISMTCLSSNGQRAASRCYCEDAADTQKDNDCLDNLQAFVDGRSSAFDYQSGVVYYGCAQDGACSSTTPVACDEGSVCSFGKCTSIDYCRDDADCPQAAEFYYRENGIQFVQSSASVCQNQVCAQQRFQVCVNADDCLTAEGNTCFNGRCTFATCGVNGRELGEQCDDGNSADRDGCSSLCTIEEGFSCVGEIGKVSVCQQSTAMFFADLRAAFKDIKEALDDADSTDDATAKETFISSIREAVARLFR